MNYFGDTIVLHANPWLKYPLLPPTEKKIILTSEIQMLKSNNKIQPSRK